MVLWLLRRAKLGMVLSVGRPSDYSEEIALEICQRIIDGRSLRAICREDDDMPAQRTVFQWLARHPEFAQHYARAKDMLADVISEECFEIADDGTNDWMHRRSEAEKGAGYAEGWVVNGENIQRSRLRCEQRRWWAGKIAPKKYGEKLTAEHTGPDGGPLVVRWAATPEEAVSDPSEPQKK